MSFISNLVLVLILQFLGIFLDLQLIKYLRLRKRVSFKPNIQAIMVLFLFLNLLIAHLLINTDPYQRSRIFLFIVGIDTTIVGMAYVTLKELINIKIDTFEYILLTIGFGACIYVYFDSILLPTIFIPYIISPFVMINAVAFQLGYRKYRHLLDPKTNNELDIAFFNNFSKTLPIVFGLLFAYFGILSIIPIDIAMIICYIFTVIGDFSIGFILYNSLHKIELQNASKSPIKSRIL